jgi:DNA-directed RNA polymerase specialized sigma24 family protein
MRHTPDGEKLAGVLTLRRRENETEEADLAWVYGAALRAAADEAAAADAAVAALEAHGGRQALMARAVSRALSNSPAEPLDALPPDEREAVGLARIVGMNVDEIAAHVGCEPGEVKSRIRSGLMRLTGGLPAAGTV